MKAFVFGFTTTGVPILGYQWPHAGSTRVLVLGGVHGDEVEGVAAAHALVGEAAHKNGFGLELVIVPAVNLDGVLMKTRVNARGVDLNRNLPSRDWNPEILNPRYPPGPYANSETENQALVKFLDSFQPQMIVSLHSFSKFMLNVNLGSRDAPGGQALLKFAEAISKKTGYPITESMGYPTPGSLGTYAGYEKEWPTLTYELERGLAFDKILEVHVAALADGFQKMAGT
jgi:protein MpaA